MRGWIRYVALDVFTDNQLENLPPELSMLSNLRQLKVESNPLPGECTSRNRKVLGSTVNRASSYLKCLRLTSCSSFGTRLRLVSLDWNIALNYAPITYGLQCIPLFLISLFD